MSERLAQVKENVIEGKDHLMKNVRDTAGIAVEGLDHQMEVLSGKIDEMSLDVRRRLRNVDLHLHEKPYVYLLAAGLAGLGIGFLLKSKASRQE